MWYPDYGEIYVCLHKGLTQDQKETMIKKIVENQLLAQNRTHYVEILHQCLVLSRILDDGVKFENKFNNFHYKYTFKLDYFDQPMKCTQKACSPC